MASASPQRPVLTLATGDPEKRAQPAILRRESLAALGQLFDELDTKVDAFLKKRYCTGERALRRTAGRTRRSELLVGGARGAAVFGVSRPGQGFAEAGGAGRQGPAGPNGRCQPRGVCKPPEPCISGKDPEGSEAAL